MNKVVMMIFLTLVLASSANSFGHINPTIQLSTLIDRSNSTIIKTFHLKSHKTRKIRIKSSAEVQLKDLTYIDSGGNHISLKLNKMISPKYSLEKVINMKDINFISFSAEAVTNVDVPIIVDIQLLD